jgi:hypothetical protein
MCMVAVGWILVVEMLRVTEWWVRCIYSSWCSSGNGERRGVDLG